MQPQLAHDFEPVTQAVGHAFHHGAHQVSAPVSCGQADKCTARQRVAMRSALTGNVGQKDQPFGAGRYHSGFSGQLVVAAARATRTGQRIPQPA